MSNIIEDGGLNVMIQATCGKVLMNAWSEASSAYTTGGISNVSPQAAREIAAAFIAAADEAEASA